jgi:hypothetical protein
MSFQQNGQVKIILKTAGDTVGNASIFGAFDEFCQSMSKPAQKGRKPGVLFKGLMRGIPIRN